MANLAVIHIVPGPMSTNLERALGVDGDIPWAFDRPLSQMRGIRPDNTYVVYVQATLANGASLGRQGSVELNTRVSRVVVGKVSIGIREVESPYFDGYSFEFRYRLIKDVSLEPTSELADAADAINEQIDGLDLRADDLRVLLSNARSAKVGMYYDGAPRLAPYFKNFEEIPTLNASSPTPATQRTVEIDSGQTSPNTPLGDAADGFVSAVREAGLEFGGLNLDLPRAFFAATATKRFAILTGMSGSGKTQLARALGQWFSSGADDASHYCVVPVRADWTSPEPLLGYEDALLPPAPDSRRAWAVPEALQFILRAHADPAHSWLLVLDEMNLAHVERYFADVLSGIESGEPIVPNLVVENGHWYQRRDESPRIALPPNLVIVGTVNVDETTYQFSPKVLDRAFTFEFRTTAEELSASRSWPQVVAPATPDQVGAYLSVLLNPDWHLQHPHPDEADVTSRLLDAHADMTEIGLEFGHRSFREALRFAAALSACAIEDPDLTWDWVVMTKLLPRVHGDRRRLEPVLKRWYDFAVGGDAEKPVHPLLARKCQRMLRALQSHQFASFSE